MLQTGDDRSFLYRGEFLRFPVEKVQPTSFGTDPDIIVFIFHHITDERIIQAIVPAVVKKAETFDGEVIFTKDTHFENYMDTQEGHFLPVPHCIKGTDGWDLIPELEKIAIERDAATYEKITFGCPELAEDLLERNKKTPIESIELVGLCTDICVVSNALLIKAFLPETPVFVDSACAAGVTRERHEAALETMRSCQIVVK